MMMKKTSRLIALVGLTFLFFACTRRPKGRELVSHYDFDTTLERLQGAIQAKGMMVMQVIRHDHLATQHGEALEPTAVILFGNPKVGTALMQEAAVVAYQLPLKIALFERDGQVVAYYEPPTAYVAYGISRHKEVLTKMEQTMEELLRSIH